MDVVVLRHKYNSIKLSTKSDTLIAQIPKNMTLVELEKKLVESVYAPITIITPEKEGAERERCGSLKPNKSIDTKPSVEFDQEMLREFYACKKTILYGYVYNVLPSKQKNTSVSRQDILLSQASFDSYDKRRHALCGIIKKSASQKLPNYVSAIGSRLSLCPSGIEICDNLNCWGECKDNLLKLRSNVIQLPPNLQLCIVVGQLYKLIASENTNLYINLIEKVLPNYKKNIQLIEHYTFLMDIF
ncbi:MAG: YgjP-like metallopeptidase domain-containing protein [Clostridia bacterium]